MAKEHGTPPSTYSNLLPKAFLAKCFAHTMQSVLQSLSCCFGSLELGFLPGFVSGAMPWMLQETVKLGNKNLKLAKQIGEGGYSFVYLARDEATGDDYALKKVLIAGPEQLKLVRQEITVMQSLQHRNLLPLLDSLTVDTAHTDGPAKQAVYLLFPLYKQGSLFEEVTRRAVQGRLLSSPDILHIFKQVCQGVQAMHLCKPALAHRDIKPHNILLRGAEELRCDQAAEDESSEDQPLQQGMGEEAGSYHAVLMDFGSAREAKVNITNRAKAVQLQEDAEANCSAPYRAPELFDVASHCSIDERVDVWSLGCLLYFMLYAVSPFERVLGGAGGSLALAVQNGHVKWPDVDTWSPGIKNLVKSCLTLDPARRPHISSVLSEVDGLIRKGVDRQHL